MPSVELSSELFARLQALAIPLVDTIESVIARLADYFESKEGAPAHAKRSEEVSVVKRFNAVSPPNLTHTKVLAVEVCGKPLQHAQANWNGMLNEAVRLAKDRAKTGPEFKQLVIIPFFEGKKLDEGFRFLPDIGVSIQGQDSNGSWKATRHIAQKLGVKISATFIWREKEGAAFPGLTGQLSVSQP